MPRKQSRSRLDLLFEQLEKESVRSPSGSARPYPGWTWECDPQGKYRACSAEVEQILGRSPDEFIGQPVFRFSLTAASAQIVKQILIRAGTGDGEPYSTQAAVEFVARDGLSVPGILHLNRPATGGWNGFFRLTPPRQEPEPGDPGLLAPILQQAPQPPGGAEVFPPAAPARKPLARGRRPLPRPSLKPRRPAPLPASGFMPQTGRGSRARAPFSYPLPRPPSEAGRQSLEQARPVSRDGGPGQEAVIAVPVLSPEGAPDLLLEILDEDASRRWSPDERLLVERVADQLAIALENARLFAENQTLARAVEAAADMVLIGGMDGVVQFANPAFYASTGYTPQEAAGLDLAVLNGDHPASALYSEIRETVLTGQVWRGEVTNRRKDGSTYEAQLAVSPIWDERGEVKQFVAVQRDISESKRHQAEREFLLRETETLYQAGARLSAASTYDALLEVLCEYTVLGHPAAVDVSLNVFDRPWTGGTRPDWLLVLGRRSRLDASATRPVRLPANLWEQAPRPTRQEGAVYLKDPARHPALRSLAVTLGVEPASVKGLVFAPMLAAGKWIGQVVGLYREAIDIGEADLRRLNSLASQAALSIENLRLLEETRRRNEELAVMNAIISAASSSLDLEAVLHEVLGRVLSALQFDSGLVALAEAAAGADLSVAVQQGLPEGLAASLVAGGEPESLCRLVIRRGEPICYADLREVSGRAAQAAVEAGLRACLGVPLRSKGEILGALCVFSRAPQELERSTLSMMQAVGQQVGVAVENARAFDLAQKAVVEIRKLDQLKSQFLANMSHELRTPLNSIIGFSRVILKGIDGPVTDLQRQDLTAIFNSGQHLLNMINEILDLSKIEAGKMEVNFEEQVDLCELIQTAVNTAQGLIKDKELEMRLELPEDLPRVRADPLILRQVLINLLSNAVKFTEAGSVTTGAAVRGEPGRQEVEVWVRDTGPGISAEDQSRLFLPFSQLDPSTTRKYGGTGLGLSISKRLVELHAGKIGVTSEPGQGSTFYFTLPLDPPGPPPGESRPTG